MDKEINFVLYEILINHIQKINFVLNEKLLPYVCYEKLSIILYENLIHYVS